MRNECGPEKFSSPILSLPKGSEPLTGGTLSLSITRKEWKEEKNYKY
jgi:hypothetical protein